MPSDREVEVPAGTTLLEAVVASGLPIARSCGADGVCAKCGLRIVAGGEALSPESEAETSIKTRNRIDPDLRLACRVTVSCNLTVTASYW